MATHERTVEVLKNIAAKYKLSNLESVLNDDNSVLFKKDIFICLESIVNAIDAEGDTLELLKEAKNLYGSPVFAINAQEGKYLINLNPDLNKAVEDMEKYSFCFKLSPYHIINTYLAIVEAQICGIDLEELYQKGVKHIEASIEQSLMDNPNWSKDTLVSDRPGLILPIGAAGCGKSTFYKELSNVVNISCDNVRYLLFKDFGPCFSSWESALSWWIVNRLTDNYLSKGYSVFYNGVNTDMEYRSPITMEDPNPLFAGIPYNIKLVYFEPPVKLSEEELKELKEINLWSTSIDDVDTTNISKNVANILEMIKINYNRTLARTKEISEGKKEQDSFDVLYAVPAPIVKLFVEQSFIPPKGDNVISVARKEIPDPGERAAFYRNHAQQVMAN